MNKKETTTLIKQLKLSIKSLESVRDELRNIISDAKELLEVSDTAYYSLEDAIGALSELV